MPGQRPLVLAAPLVPAEDVELERRPLVPVVALVTEVAVVEGELVVADHGHAGGEVDVTSEGLDLLLVRPRAHEDAARDAVADRGERAQVRAGVGVEPAALLEDRHGHPLGPVAELLPVRVVLLVLPPLAPVADLAAERDLVELDQGQVAPDRSFSSSSRALGPVTRLIALVQMAAAPRVSASWNAPPVQ